LTFRGPRVASSRTQVRRQAFEPVSKAATKRVSNSLVRQTAVAKVSHKLTARNAMLRNYADDSNLPISPHLTIYKQSLPAWTSIAHRVAGVALFGVFAYIGVKAWWINPSVYSYFSAVEDFKVNHPWLLLDAKLTLAASFSYHWWAGLRHLWIESPSGSHVLDSNSKVDTVALSVIALSIASTGLIMWL